MCVEATAGLLGKLVTNAVPNADAGQGSLARRQQAMSQSPRQASEKSRRGARGCTDAGSP